MTKPTGRRRVQQQPDGNIVWLVKRNQGVLIIDNYERLVALLVRANKPTNKGEVRKAVSRLSKAADGVKIEELRDGKFKLTLM